MIENEINTPPHPNQTPQYQNYSSVTSNAIESEHGKQRIVGLDVLRVFFVLLIFFFHSRVHLGCSYGVLNDCFNTPMVGMSGFFMLSGYALVVAYLKKNLFDKQTITLFYKKRFVAIYPLYFIVGILAVIMNILAGTQTIQDNLLLSPVEILGIQSFFDGAFFSYSHNSGTWFVSCILFCYLLFPIIKEIVGGFKFSWLIIFVVLSLFILSYFQILPRFFKCGSIYTNPFIRMFEFCLGMSLAFLNLKEEGRNKFLDILRFWPMMLLAFLLLIVCCYMNSTSKYLLLYLGLSIMFMVMGSRNSIVKGGENKVLMYASNISYAFFLGQFFVWKPIKFIQLYFGSFSNIINIVFSFVMCCVVSVALYEIIEKKIGGKIKSLVFRVG